MPFVLTSHALLLQAQAYRSAAFFNFLSHEKVRLETQTFKTQALRRINRSLAVPNFVVEDATVGAVLLMALCAQLEVSIFMYLGCYSTGSCAYLSCKEIETDILDL